MGIYTWFWKNCGTECVSGRLLDVNGSRAICEYGDRQYDVPISDVMPAAIDEWHETNGQFGVGA
jgi:hypothetical protein